ncbi:MAG: DoxX family protein [Bacteroidetes bacterium]|nr:DoxX family protein [Bacteroidota bacterium]
MIENLIDPLVFLSFFIRVVAGILFFFQGYDKVFHIGIQGVINTVGPSYRAKGFPAFSVKLISYLTSWIELVGGLLLIVGFLTYPAIYILGIDLIIVIFGMSILEPVWDMKLVFPRLVLLSVLLLLPEGVDLISLDHLLF